MRLHKINAVPAGEGWRESFSNSAFFSHTNTYDWYHHFKMMILVLLGRELSLSSSSFAGSAYNAHFVVHGRVVAPPPWSIDAIPITLRLPRSAAEPSWPSAMTRLTDHDGKFSFAVRRAALADTYATLSVGCRVGTLGACRLRAGTVSVRARPAGAPAFSSSALIDLAPIFLVEVVRVDPLPVTPKQPPPTPSPTPPLAPALHYPLITAPPPPVASAAPPSDRHRPHRRRISAPLRALTALVFGVLWCALLMWAVRQIIRDVCSGYWCAVRCCCVIASGGVAKQQLRGASPLRIDAEKGTDSPHYH